MTIISPEEFTLLMSLSGYEQNLKATNIGKKYGMSAGQIIAMLPNQPASSGTKITNVSMPIQPGRRFEYDPSPEAKDRRVNVTQAVNCPSCGAALGIPAIRPIKVTCPQCSEEHVFHQ